MQNYFLAGAHYALPPTRLNVGLSGGRTGCVMKVDGLGRKSQAETRKASSLELWDKSVQNEAHVARVIKGLNWSLGLLHLYLRTAR